MVHTNPARLDNGVLAVDRKFHTGMQEYLSRLAAPLVSIHPELPATADSTVMDLIEVPERELGYRVLTMSDASGQLGALDRQKVHDVFSSSRLVYGGGLGTLGIATKLGVPVVGIVEYNLKTTVVFSTGTVQGALRKGLRCAGAVRHYVKNVVPLMRQAALLHCNGYPVFEEAAWLNQRRLLYLDSRMRSALVISEELLEQRLQARPTRKPRLLYSGRFEPAKGALDAVLVAAECHKNGLDFEMQLYGQGSQRAEMIRAIEQHDLGAKVVVHDAVSFPELVQIARGCDAFVCCHVQDDPSCTYLESLGCGLPIAGYANAMWRSMHEACGAGIVTPKSPAALAAALTRLLQDHARLDELSRGARAFAAQHSFEHEFSLRVESLVALYTDGRAEAGHAALNRRLRAAG